MDALEQGHEDLSKKVTCISSQISEESTRLSVSLHTGHESMKDFFREQGLQNRHALLQDILHVFHKQLPTTVSRPQTSGKGSLEFDESTFGASTVTTVPKTSSRIRGLKTLRCKCKSGRFAKAVRVGPLQIRREQQPIKACPLHGTIGQQNYSVEANMSPFFNGSVQVALDVFFRGSRGWSILPSLRFHATVQRSKNPIFMLFDNFVSSCVKLEPANRNSKKTLFETTGEVDEDSRLVHLIWDRPNIKSRLASLIRGIEEATILGTASCSDVDQYGSNLLFVGAHNLTT